MFSWEVLCRKRFSHLTLFSKKTQEELILQVQLNTSLCVSISYFTKVRITFILHSYYVPKDFDDVTKTFSSNNSSQFCLQNQLTCVDWYYLICFCWQVKGNQKRKKCLWRHRNVIRMKYNGDSNFRPRWLCVVAESGSLI